VAAPRQALRAQPPSARRQSPKHWVALARATGGPRRWRPSSGPGGAPRAPRGQAGGICHQEQAPPPRGRPAQRWPRGWPPGAARRWGARVCHPARLGPGTPQGVQPGRALRTLGEHPTRAPAPHAEKDGVPPGRLTPPPPGDQPRATPPRVCAAWASTALGDHRRAGRPGGPGRASARPAARHRDQTGGGPSARPTPPWAPGAPAEQATR
jgi:hypothetical protein